jgi:putative tricarboxylic transport membrane protein
LLLAHGDATVFVTRPISAVMLGLAVLAMVMVLSPALSKKREEAFREED